MMPERSQEIERLYHEARGRTPSERPAFLDRACAGDESLRTEVESLLAWREEAAGFLPTQARGAVESASAATDSLGSSASTLGATRTLFSRRRPWWIWGCSVPSVVTAAIVYFVVLAAPPRAGWKLRIEKAGGRPVAYRVIATARGTAADRAGFDVNDLVSVDDVERFAGDQRTGVDHVFNVVRAGTRRTLTLTTDAWTSWGGRERLRRLAVTAASAAHLALAVILVAARPRDRAARWGALLFAQIAFYMTSTTAAARFAPESAHYLRALPFPIGALVLFAWSVSSMMPAAAFGFCAVFPRPLPLSNQRWWPWWLLAVALVATTGVDLDFAWLPVYAGPDRPDVPRLVLAAEMALGVIFVTWAVALFARSYRRIDRPNERRRVRLVIIGFAITASTLAVDMLLMTPWAPVERVRPSGWWEFSWVVLLSAAALCMTYAVLRHRVFDIQIIVRLGLRYAAARGALLSVVPVTGLVLALDVLVHRSRPVSEIAAQRGLIYLVLCAAALALHIKRKSWLDALDRRFFRERYDAARLLGGVADDVRRSASFDDAARHVITRIDDALHPESASLMVRYPGDGAFRSAASINEPPPPVPGGARLVGLVRLLGRPLENAQGASGWLQHQLPRAEVEFLWRARVEWLFPVSLREGGPEAFLLLGPKRSEEPYSREDRHLLGAVAASLGLLLERPAPSGFSECSACGTCYDAGSVHCVNGDGTLVKFPYTRTIASRYRFDRRLGSGGMGVVYGAFDGELKRQVAVKVIRPELLTSPDALARFRREARTAASLVHPAVVSVYDFGVADDGRAYIVMELLKGRTLREELRERGRLDQDTALEILRGACEGVSLAHENGLIHRDLKPENIFLEQAGDRQVTKILDFGLAKPLAPEATGTVAPTLPGALIGTPAYMSPEQLRGDVPTERWDVWALAVVAFEMLTGIHPSVLLSDTRSWVAGDRGATASPEPPELPAPSRTFFERAFAPDCSRRPESARQLLDELGAALRLGADTPPGAVTRHR